MLSEDIYHMVAEEIEAVFFEEVQVRGRQKPVKLYELRSL
jgi:class 3 adenylate cyclase